MTYYDLPTAAAWNAFELSLSLSLSLSRQILINSSFHPSIHSAFQNSN